MVRKINLVEASPITSTSTVLYVAWKGNERIRMLCRVVHETRESEVSRLLVVIGRDEM